MPPVSMISESEGLVLGTLENVKGDLFSCIFFLAMFGFPGKIGTGENRGGNRVVKNCSLFLVKWEYVCDTSSYI